MPPKGRAKPKKNSPNNSRAAIPTYKINAPIMNTMKQPRHPIESIPSLVNWSTCCKDNKQQETDDEANTVDSHHIQNLQGTKNSFNGLDCSYNQTVSHTNEGQDHQKQLRHNKLPPNYFDYDTEKYPDALCILPSSLPL